MTAMRVADASEKSRLTDDAVERLNHLLGLWVHVAAELHRRQREASRAMRPR